MDGRGSTAMSIHDPNTCRKSRLVVLAHAVTAPCCDPATIRIDRRADQDGTQGAGTRAGPVGAVADRELLEFEKDGAYGS